MIGDNIETIDKYRLDDEWVKQPDMYYQYAKKLAKAKRELAEKELEVKLIAAQLHRKIRENPEDYFPTSKTTKDAIDSMVIEQTAFIKVKREAIVCQYRVDLLFGIERKLVQRKEAIQDLVKLQGRDYFATPSVHFSDIAELENIKDKIVAARTKPKRKKDEKQND